MVSSTIKSACRLAALLCAAVGMTQASSVVVANTDGSVYKYIAQPLLFFRSYVTAPAVVKVLPKPDGSKIYIATSDATKSIVILSPDFSSEVHPALPVPSITNAWLTADGSRLIVQAGLALRIFDTSSDTEVTPKYGYGYNVGTADDVAVGPDSTKVYTFSGTTQTVYLVDLVANKVATSVPVKQPSGYIQVAPNGLLYFDTNNVLYEMDPSTLAIRNQIDFSGQPGKLTFSADSTRAFAANAQVVGNSPILSYDLVNRVLANGAGTIGTTYQDITVINPAQLLAVNVQSHKVTLIPSAGGAASDVTFQHGTGSYDSFMGILTSEEVPAPKTLFLLQSNRVISVDPATFTVIQEQPLPAGTPLFATYLKDAATGAPASSIAYGTAQTLAPGAASAPVGVRIMNSAGRPLGGVTVTFTATTPGLTLAASSAVTTPDGYAYTSFTAPQTVGTYTLTATASGITNTYTITVAASSPGGGGGPAAGAPTIYSGNGQITFQSTPGAAPLVVQVLNSSGAPMPGVTVNWAVSTGFLTLNAAPSVTTDQNGLAQVTFIGAIYIQPLIPYDRSTVTATTPGGTATFTVTTLANTPTGQGASVDPRLITPPGGARSLSGRVGQTLTGGIQVTVRTTYFGQVALSGVGVTATTGNNTSGPTAQCKGGVTLTDNTGLASCDLVIGGTPGTSQVTVTIGGITSFIPIPLTATQGDAALIVPTAGDKSSGNPGQTVTLRALLKDAGGNLLTGMNATWKVVTAGTATVNPASSTSDSQGQISTVVTLGNTSGPVQIQAVSGSASYTFTVTVNAPPPPAGTLAKVSGDSQSAAVSQAFAKPLVVKMVDTNNNPVAGVTVNFSVSGGVAFLSASTGVTDATGSASVIVTASNTTGAVTVQAAVGSQTVTFSLTVTPPGPVIDGFYDLAGFQPGLAPGALVRLVGKNLAPDLNGPVFGGALFSGFSDVVNGVSVQIGGITAPIYDVSNMDGQQFVDLQVPFEVPVGPTTVVVTVNGQSTTSDAFTVSQYLPGIFLHPAPDGTTYGVVLKADGSPLSPTNPATRGDILTLVAGGLGPISPAAGTNKVGTGNQNVQADMIVGVNYYGMRVISAQYAANLIGVYLITFELDPNTAPGPNRVLQIAIRVGDSTINSNATVIPLIQ